MSGKASQRKGARGEREAASLLRQFYPDAKRGLQQRRDANEAPDVTGTPFWVEVKWQKRPSIHAAYEQAKAATDGRPVLIMTKRPRESVLVTMEWGMFEKLMRNARGGHE